MYNYINNIYINNIHKVWIVYVKLYNIDDVKFMDYIDMHV